MDHNNRCSSQSAAYQDAFMLGGLHWWGNGKLQPLAEEVKVLHDR
jgi:hypothetical protein